MLNKFIPPIVILCALLTISCTVKAQATPNDTLRLTIKQAEDQFLKSNLQLIAERYNIDNANAAILTARLFNNPDFSFSNGIHANDAAQGPAYKDQSFSISQLFNTAGKRNKNIRLAKVGVDQARFQFFDLLRTLKYTLRNDFYTIYFQQQSAKVYTEEINSLAGALPAFKEEYAKGNVAEKEVLRIQSQLYTLQAEYNNLLSGIDTVQREFKVLIHADPAVTVKPIADINIDGKTVLGGFPYQRLLDSAYINRYDLRLAKATVDYNNVNLLVQKATAVPDISFSLNYDKLGSYGTNYLGAGLDFSLPFFNRNQGGIKQARIAIDQSKVQLQSTQEQLEADVSTYYKSALRFETVYNGFDPAFRQDFTNLIKQVFINYQKKNISLLEFLDFYESYKTNTLQLNTLQLNRLNSLEQLNFVTGTPFFNQ